MHVRVISPERAVYDGDATSVVAPAFDGEVGILPQHAPFITLLGEGPLRVHTGTAESVFHIRGGFLQVIHDRIRIVTEHVHEGG